MNTDLKIIKKYYGENMMHYARDNFSIILEKEGRLSNLFLDNFEESKTLYEDLKENDALIKFKNYIYKLYHEKKDEDNNEITNVKTPNELMNEAGYTLYECKTEADIQSFEKYYAFGEELCTFKGGRLNTNKVFFAVKKDVDNIKRENFKNPKREDEYGTSVISIQFTKDGTNTLSIKNRYNQRVKNPDATFKNNLDNVILGLTKSFELYYGIKQEYVNKQNFGEFVRANNGKYYKYNYESGNKYYCPNNIIIDNFEVKKYPKEKYIILDYFILDLVKKKIYLYDADIQDSFTDTIKNINKIEINKSGTDKIININVDDNEENIEIIIDKYNRIISYKNNVVKVILENFLIKNTVLKTIILQNTEYIYDDFLLHNNSLEYIDAPEVKEIERNFLKDNNSLKCVVFPKVKYIGCYFMPNNNVLEYIMTPEIVTIETNFLYSNKNIKVFNAPKLQFMEMFSFYELLKNNGYEKNVYFVHEQIELVRLVKNTINRNNKINKLKEIKNNLKNKIKQKVLRYKK